MQFNEVKNGLEAGLRFGGLDESTAATLLWRGAQENLGYGEVVYREGQDLDQTFCLLLSGSVAITKGDTVVAELTEPQFFGEMAYFTNPQTRRATVTVSSMQAVLLKFYLTASELGSPRFATLKNYLSR